MLAQGSPEAASPLEAMTTPQALLLARPLGGELCQSGLSGDTETEFNYMLSQDTPPSEGLQQPAEQARTQPRPLSAAPPSSTAAASPGLAGNARPVWSRGGGAPTDFAAFKEANQCEGAVRKAAHARRPHPTPPAQPQPQPPCPPTRPVWHRGGGGAINFSEIKRLNEHAAQGTPTQTPLRAPAERVPRACGGADATPAFGGFATGRGSAVPVSEMAMRRSMQFMADLEKELETELGQAEHPADAIGAGGAPAAGAAERTPLPAQMQAASAVPIGVSPHPQASSVSGRVPLRPLPPPPAPPPAPPLMPAPQPHAQSPALASAHVPTQGAQRMPPPLPQAGSASSSKRHPRSRPFEPPLKRPNNGTTPPPPPLPPAGPGGASGTPRNGIRTAAAVAATAPRAQPAPSALPSLFDLSALAARRRMSLRALAASVDPGMPLASARARLIASARTFAAARTFAFGGADEGGTPPRGSAHFLGLLRERGARLEGEDGRAWVERHFALVVWKLAATEARFGAASSPAAVYLSEARTLRQLCYRYERELVANQRSVLKRVVEGDAHPARAMVVCVCDLTVGGRAQPAERAAVAGAAAEPAQPLARATLTDGWAVVGAELDPALTSLCRRGKVRPGVKLLVCGARLSGGDGGGQPRLGIHANGTRLARWDAQLGAQRMRTPPRLSLGTLSAGGGAAPALRLVVQRHYPLQFLERRPDGTKLVRSERAEQEHVERRAAEHASALELFHSALQSGARRARPVPPGAPGELEELLQEASGAELAALALALVETDFERAARCVGSLSADQRASLAECCGAAPPAELVLSARDVVPFCRLAVSDAGDSTAVAELTVWRPPEHLHAAGALDGSVWELTFVDVSAARPPALSLASARPGAGASAVVIADAVTVHAPHPQALSFTTTRLTTWTRIEERSEELLPRAPLPFSALAQLRAGCEFCTLGALLHVSEPFDGGGSGGSYCNVFVGTPEATDVLCIKVRGEQHAHRALNKLQKLSAVLVITDARYASADEQLGTHLAYADEQALAPARAAPAYARGIAEALASRLASDHRAMLQLEARQRHIHALVSGQRIAAPPRTPGSALPLRCNSSACVDQTRHTTEPTAVATPARPAVPSESSETVVCVLCGITVLTTELEAHMTTCCCGIGLSQG